MPVGLSSAEEIPIKYSAAQAGCGELRKSCPTSTKGISRDVLNCHIIILSMERKDKRKAFHIAPGRRKRTCTLDRLWPLH